MTDAVALLYLESDDEVTSVVRRIRALDAERIVLVAPGRSRATSSVVALRLLARVADATGRGLSVVGDPLTRSLAAEAGLDAWATIADARTAEPMTDAEAPSARAPIRVVRGDVSEETTGLAPAVVSAPQAGMPGPALLADAEETREVTVPRARVPPPPVVGAARKRRAGRAVVIPAALIALLLVGVTVGVLAVAPAASIRLVPASRQVGPSSYALRITDPGRVQGTVEATATVTASGTYPIQAPATGTVVFRNFNTVAVAVGAGALVAAGEQAYETVAEIVVPAGTLTAEGTIRAGEEAVDVRAAAAGPDGNVAAEAIDTVLSQNVAARLRGFPNNTQRLVINPEPTSGGIDDVGAEILQADVDAARAQLISDLEDALIERFGGTDGQVVESGTGASEPRVEGLDGLVGTRDQETAEIQGSIEYDRMTVERSEVDALAESRVNEDRSLLPEGTELVPGSHQVQIVDANRDGSELVVRVEVAATVVEAVDRQAIVDLVGGLSVDQAEAALAPLGDATVELWPGWVASVPALDWRVSVTVEGEPVPSTAP